MGKFVLNRNRGKWNKDKAIKLLETRMYRLNGEQQETAVRLVNKFYREGGLSKKQWHIVRYLPGQVSGEGVRKRPDGPCYVYMVSDGESVKIGISKNPEQRLKMIQTSHPKPLALAGKHLFENRECASLLEKYLHEACGRMRTRRRGEWFRAEAAAVFNNACAMEWRERDTA